MLTVTKDSALMDSDELKRVLKVGVGRIVFGNFDITAYNSSYERENITHFAELANTRFPQFKEVITVLNQFLEIETTLYKHEEKLELLGDLVKDPRLQTELGRGLVEDLRIPDVMAKLGITGQSLDDLGEKRVACKVLLAAWYFDHSIVEYKLSHDIIKDLKLEVFR